ncbi:MAG: SUMF1/EgtB/PvdO family nonheme iron enzyme [Bacteroidales bacterium]|nr:SUMF1/EgtB/PvdO family nonheme iron enzyme [Bacteroidales bacterium]
MIRKLVVFLILISAFAKLQSQDNRGFKPVTIKIGEQQTKLYNESHALVIGISDYTGGWPSLPGVKNDVVAVKTALEKQGFEVTLLENANKEQIDKSISNFINKYGQDSDNRLLFYFAGHGHTIKTSYGDELGYIVPNDAPNPNKDAAGFQNKAMEMAQIEIYAKRIQSKHALFLFDACFSGSLFALSRAAPEIINYKISQPVRQFISSGSATETVPDVSIFRKQFVTAITTIDADANKDGYLTGTELGDFLQTSVVNYSNNTQHPQYGKIRNPNLDKGDFVFVISKQEEVAVTEAATTTSTGSIQLISEISGKLYIDGVFYKEITEGSTSLFNNIQSGLRIINIKGTSNWTEKIMVISNQTTTVRAKNETGTIALYSEINGKLYVDEVFNSSIVKGSTTNIDNLTAGVHNLKIDGSQAWNEKVNVSSGQTTNITASPEISNYTTPVATNSNYTESSSGINLDMVFIKGGTFNMGSPNSEVDRDDDEYEHSVTVSDFYMGKYEVTQGQWKAVMGSNPSASDKGIGDNYPVNLVSWNDIQTFISKLNQMTGKRYRLPTEAEWEFAARGGTTTPFNTGNNLSTSQANYNGNYPYNGNPKGTYKEKTMPVGSYSPNAWGLYDMHGNVLEWCSDWYASDYYKNSPQNNPKGPTTAQSPRVLRGGSWSRYAGNCRSAYRSYSSPGIRRDYIGFRLVLVP